MGSYISSTTYVPRWLLQCRTDNTEVDQNTAHQQGYQAVHVDGSPVFSYKEKLKTSKASNRYLSSAHSASPSSALSVQKESSCSEESLLGMCLLSKTFSQLYKMRQKYEDASKRADHLNDELVERNRQVKELCVVIREFKTTALEHRKQIEFQRNQIGVQQGMLREMYIGFQLIDTPDHMARDMAGNVGGAPREYFILRKYYRSLVSVTRPVVGRVIHVACEAGLVSSDIGMCAEQCSGEDHDCTDEFYKALQFTVNQRPTALIEFLHLIQDKIPSPPCQQLCKTIQVELNYV